MLDVRTILLTIAVVSTMLVLALWTGSRGQRGGGLAAWITALGLQTITTFLFSARDHLPYELGVTFPNVLYLLGIACHAHALRRFAGRTLSVAWFVLPGAALAVTWSFLRDDFAARLAVGNGCYALAYAIITVEAWRRLRAHRGGARGLFVAALATFAVMHTIRGIGPLFAPSGTLLAPSLPQVVTFLGLLGGSLGASIGFLMLHQDRAEQALASLNATLDQRVREQVQQIVAQARETERLNIELRQKVKERSQELTAALARAAHGRAGNELTAGATLADRFVVESELGRGGMGVVYRARDTATGEPVALKVIEASSADELAALYRFLREASASAHVSHPGVVYARHVDLADGRLFMVFELVEGAALDRVLRLERALAPGAVALLGARVAEVLAAAHASGVVHRDLKPANVMVASGTNPVRLLDFGVARLHDAALVSSEQTRRGALLGTPSYMSPEQVLDSASTHDRSDVYSLGVMLFQLLAGRLPFEERELQAQLVARLLRDPPPLQEVAPEVPAALAECVRRCLARLPEERPSAADVARELDAIAAELGASPDELAALGARASTQPASPSGHETTVSADAA